jgi:hypothetical protein
MNIATGPASGARHRSGTRNTRSATIGRAAKAQYRTSTGTCAVVCIRVRFPGSFRGLLTETNGSRQARIEDCCREPSWKVQQRGPTPYPFRST